MVTNQKDEIKIYSANDALKPIPPMRWLVEKLITEDSVSVLVGEPGSLKTYSMLALCVCLATGLPWVGMKTECCRALFIDEESGPKRLLRRIKRVMRGHEIESDIPFYFISLAGFNLRNQQCVRNFTYQLEQVRPQVVVIDALADVMPGGDENLVRDVQPLFMNLRRIAVEMGCAIIIIHHTNRNGKYRGSSSIKGAVDLLLNVEKPKNSDVLKFAVEKTRDGEPFTFFASAFFEDSEDIRFVLTSSAKTAALKRRSDVEEFVVNFLDQHGEASVEEITQAALSENFSRGQTRQAIYGVRADGVIYRSNAGGRGTKAIFAKCSD